MRDEECQAIIYTVDAATFGGAVCCVAPRVGICTFVYSTFPNRSAGICCVEVEGHTELHHTGAQRVDATAMLLLVPASEATFVQTIDEVAIPAALA